MKIEKNDKMKKAISQQQYFRNINFSLLKSVEQTIPYKKERNDLTKIISH